MAPMRAKCCDITNIALWRYLTASSGLANWAEAGRAAAAASAAMARGGARLMGNVSSCWFEWPAARGRHPRERWRGPVYSDARRQHAFGWMGARPREARPGSTVRCRPGRGEQLLQAPDIRGLHQVLVEAGTQRLLPVLRLPVTRHGDQRHRLAAAPFAHRPRQLVAVHAGQAHVDQCNLGVLRIDAFERG